MLLDSDIKKISILRTTHPEIRIGLCHGVFDILHAGHINYFTEAKTLCDYLVVSLTADKFVNKGPYRPFQNELDRKKILESLRVIDLVVISEYHTSIEIINQIKPSIYFKGQEYRDFNNDLTGNIKLEIEAMARVGGTVHFTIGETNSSSSIISSIKLNYGNKVQTWIKNNRDELSKSLLNSIDEVSKLKVAVIGELIIDEYRFTQALGKVSKHPILAHKEEYRKLIGGGTLAIARHIETFVEKVKLITIVGNDFENRFSDLTEKSLGKIQLHSIHDSTRPTIRKIRYIDSSTSSHIFEKYIIDDSYINEQISLDLVNVISREVQECDLILISDFGHGMFAPNVTKYINELPSQKLCINVQANAGNAGKNTINKYPKRLMASMNGSELELLLRQTGINFTDMVTEYLKFEETENIIITHGNKGLALRSGKNIIEVPAFTNDVIDKVGAGDAVFAISSLMFAVQAPLNVNAFAASLAGAMSALTFGNSNPIQKKDFLKASRHLI